jgi:uncharacterized RDD family membrane protein YckC
LSNPIYPIPFDPPSPLTPLPLRPVCALWRRSLAFAVDGLLLALLGSAIGVILFNKLSDLGPWGRLVGFLIDLPYFALLESNLGDGHTIGRRLLSLRVVKAQGTNLSLSLSLSLWSLLQNSGFKHI